MAFKKYGFGAGASGFVARQANVPAGSIVPLHQSILNERYVYDEFRQVDGMAVGGGAAVTTTNVGNTLFTGNRSGVFYTIINIGTMTIMLPVLAPTGLDIGSDASSSEGFEILFGAGAGATARGRLAFNPSVDKALANGNSFFMRLQLSIADVSGTDAFYVGFRKAQAYQSTFANYTDIAALGFHTTTAPTQTIQTYRKGGVQAVAATAVDTAKTWADAATHTLGLKISTTGPSNTGGGLVQWMVDDLIVAPTTQFAFNFVNTDVLFPFIRYVNSAGGNAGSIILSGLEIGFEPQVAA